MARNQFNTISVRKPSRNRFSMAHDVKLSMEMGKLVPISVLECIPGDSWNLSAESLIRFAPMIAPVMHSVNVHVHWFFVPNRIVWSNWEKFISPPTADDVVPPAFPTMSSLPASSSLGSLGDYLGLPVSVTIPSGEVSALPFAAYQTIYNEYYRDQNLQAGLNTDSDRALPLLDGVQSDPRTSRLATLRNRAWMHDYFTGSLPFAQKGASVDIPLGGFAPVYHNLDNQVADWDVINPTADLINVAGKEPEITPADPFTNLYADLGDSSAATINSLRVAMRTQEFLEKQARGGSRYIEQIRSHFGVNSSDQRLNRPEFIGGTTNPVVISEVLQTSSSDESTPQATMAGHGISGSRGRTFRYFCEEHGYIMGIMSITPKTAYQQGLPRHFSRRDMYDFAWPTFAHIGEQEVLSKELYYDATEEDNDATFGYVPRYAEYRYVPSRVAGEFRTSLAFWHFGRIFENRPYLNADFIECKPRQDPFAVQTPGNQNIWAHVFNNVKVSRLLPKYGTPTL